MNILLCMPTHNRVQLLNNALDSLFECSPPHEVKFELLVVENGCTDGTIRYLETIEKQKQHPEWIGFSWLSESNLGRSNAINRALDFGEHRFIGFIDDDHRFDQAFIRTIELALLEYLDADIICGQVIPDWDGTEPKWVHETGPYKIIPPPIPDQRFGDAPCVLSEIDQPVPGGGNLFVHQKVFKEVGGFATELGRTGDNVAGSEDIDFIVRALTAGFHIQYSPDIKQYHYVDPERLELGYMVKRTYQRSYEVSSLNSSENGVPRYMYRKLISNVMRACIGIGTNKWLYYTLRVAANLGEMSGMKSNRQTS